MVQQVVKELVVAAAIMCVAMIAATQAAIAGCGRVTLAEMNWATAKHGANVDKFILENGYSCEVDLVPGDTVPTVKSMTESNHPDIASQIWMNVVQKQINKAVDVGRLTIAGETLSDGGEEGWWVPKYMVEQYLPRIEDASSGDGTARPVSEPGGQIRRRHTQLSCRLGVSDCHRQPLSGIRSQG